MNPDPAPLATPTQLADIEAVRQVKARYFRGVDSADSALVRSVLAEDCTIDYLGCFTDPVTGHDFFPELNVVIRGRAAWVGGGVAARGIVTVHQAHHHEILITGQTTAQAVWSMTDRLFLPPGGQQRLIEGFGLYHDTYEKVGGSWFIKTARLQRIRVGAS